MTSLQLARLSHRPNCSFLLLACLLVILTTCRASPRSSYALFHRFGPSMISGSISTKLSATEWQKRAVLEISLAAEFNSDEFPQSKDSQFRVSSFAKLTEPLRIPESASLDSLEYQISLVPQDSQELPGESGRPDTGFAMSSFPLCAFLSDQSSAKSPLDEYLNIWVQPSSTDLPEMQSIHNLQLDLLGIHWSSSLSTSTAVKCDEADLPLLDTHKPESSLLLRSKLDTLALNHGQSNFKVSVRKPERLPEPVLTPYLVQKTPEFLPDGTAKPPEPEKGWLAKYWMYILPVVVMLVVGGGPPPPEEAGDQKKSTPAREN